MQTTQLARTQPLPIRWLGFLSALLISLVMTQAWAEVNPKDSPPDFVQAVADQALDAVKNSTAAQEGDREAIDALIDEYVLPYVNFEKTTRLATGPNRSEEHTSELQSHGQLVCRLLLDKKNQS